METCRARPRGSPFHMPAELAVGLDPGSDPRKTVTRPGEPRPPAHAEGVWFPRAQVQEGTRTSATDLVSFTWRQRQPAQREINTSGVEVSGSGSSRTKFLWFNRTRNETYTDLFRRRAQRSRAASGQVRRSRTKSAIPCLPNCAKAGEKGLELETWPRYVAPPASNAGVTQLVECNLAKVDVASSSLVTRSLYSVPTTCAFSRALF